MYAIDVEWTERATQMIEGGEYKYISLVFAYDKKTGKVKRLLHAALTNNPALDGMDAVAASQYQLLNMEKLSMNELLEQLRWLLNMYRVIKRHLDELTKQFRWALTSREMYKWLQITPVETLTDIQRAARFYYLQKLAFGGKVANQNFGTATTTAPRLNLLRLEEELSQTHLRLSQTYIEHTLKP